MFIPKLLAIALAAVLAAGGVTALAAGMFDGDDDGTVAAKDIELRKEDGVGDIELVQDDEDDDPTGDGDKTRGDDGTGGGDNTGDRDDTRGNDGTRGGDNTGDGDATRGDDGTRGGDNSEVGAAPAAAAAPAVAADVSDDAPAPAAAAPAGSYSGGGSSG